MSIKLILKLMFNYLGNIIHTESDFESHIKLYCVKNSFISLETSKIYLNKGSEKDMLRHLGTIQNILILDVSYEYFVNFAGCENMFWLKF